MHVVDDQECEIEEQSLFITQQRVYYRAMTLCPLCCFILVIGIALALKPASILHWQGQRGVKQNFGFTASVRPPLDMPKCLESNAMKPTGQPCGESCFRPVAVRHLSHRGAVMLRFGSVWLCTSWRVDNARRVKVRSSPRLMACLALS